MRRLLIPLAIAGCYRAAAPEQPPANKVETRRTANVDDPLAFLPLDAELVIGLDASALRQSALYRDLEPQLLGALGGRLAQIRECGIDPHTVRRVTIAGKVAQTRSDFDGVAVVQGVDAPSALACIAKYGAEDGKVTNERGVVTVAQSDGKSTAWTAVGPSAVVVHVSRTATAATLGGVLASGSPLRSSPAFMAMYNRRERGAALFAIVNGSAPFMADLSSLGIQPRWVDGTVIVTDRMTGVLRMTLASSADADKVVQMVAPMLGFARSSFERFDVRADGAVVRFDLVANEAQIRSLATGAFGP